MRTSLLGIFYILAILNFLSAQSNPDCTSPFPICEKASYHFEDLEGPGQDDDNIATLSCTPENFKEMHSHWMKFGIEKSGTLMFSINPEKEYHDVDFILFKSENFSCHSLEEIRCMATGQSLGISTIENLDCLGSTGLRMDATDKFEYFGCKLGDDNYLKYLDAREDEEYILFINNYHTNGAISVTFEGSAELSVSDNCKDQESIRDLQINNVFPNPASQNINLQFVASINQNVTLEILDIQSNILYSQNLNPEGNITIKEIDIKSFPSGSYLIRIKQGRQVAVRQFVKI